MTFRQIKAAIVVGLVVAISTQACTNPTSTASSTQLTPSMAAATPTDDLATPYAQEPAAGICATFDGPTVTVTINVDAASPRCAEVRSDQTLTVVNATLNTVQVSIGNFSSSILPGAEYSIEVPFGKYLATGVHQLTVTPYFGAELWLKYK